MRTATLVIVLGCIASCHTEAPLSSTPGESLDGGPANIGVPGPTIEITVADGVTSGASADGGIHVGDVDAGFSPTTADAGLDDASGLNGGQGDADVTGDAQLPNDAPLDVGLEASGADAGPVGFFPPFSQASSCPELPRRCSRRGDHTPTFDYHGPTVPGRWAPESAWVTDQGKVMVRSAWVHATFCLDSRADLLPTGWITVELDPSTLSASVVSFVADDPRLHPAGAQIDSYDDGTAVGWYYRGLAKQVAPTPGDVPGEPAWFHEVKVGDIEVHTHSRSVELVEPDVALTGGITVTQGGVVTPIDVSLSVCQTTADQLLRSGCVCGDEATPDMLPGEIPEGVDFITFELDGKVVSIVAEGATSLVGSCCYGVPFKKGSVKVPTLHISLSAWPLDPKGPRWRTFELNLPVNPVKEPSFRTTKTLGYLPGSTADFLFHDGTEPPGATMASFDFYTSGPLYAFNPYLGKHETLWFNVRLTHLDETLIEGEFEGLVAPCLYWDDRATLQVAPAVPLENGRFRLTNANYVPFP